ncbi:MAG: FAD:protein FMN transferase [Oscillospiraceae bacterium]|nr:FAD:protein FMN transferase [Oscillospiraceae bacterium]
MSLFKGISLIKLIFLGTFILLLSVLTGCGKNEPVSKTDLAMGTVITQLIYGNDANEVSNNIINQINDLEMNYLSWRINSSDVARINAFSGSLVKVDSRTLSWIRLSTDISGNCGGVFDITVGKLTDLWGIGGDNADLPSQEDINAAVKTIDYRSIRLSETQVEIADGQSLDLGAVGKGIACDIIRDLLKKSSVEGAVISVGGSILLYGENPKADSWTVGIKHPRGDSYVITIPLKETCISTSGDYERFLEKDGKTYHHILDPKTGYPADSDIISATVICDSGLLSDALSTACFILGYEKSLPLLEKYSAQAVFIDKDFNVYATDGIVDLLSINNDDFKLTR